MLGQSVIPKQIEEIKSKDRFLQVKTYFILANLQKSAIFEFHKPSYNILWCPLEYVQMPSLGKERETYM